MWRTLAVTCVTVLHAWSIPSAGGDVLPKVTVLANAGSPVLVESARLTQDDSGTVLECALKNEAGEAAVQVDGLLLIYDSRGRRKTAQPVAVAAADLPIKAHDRRMSRLSLPFLTLQQSDTVRLGLTLVATVGAPTWTNESLGDDSDAEMDAAATPPELVVADPADAPAIITNVAIHREADGNPLAVGMVVRNRSVQPIFGFGLVVWTFDTDGRPCATVFRNVTEHSPLFPQAGVPILIPINGRRAPNGRVFVAMTETKNPPWANRDTTELATTAMRRAIRQR